MKSTAYLPAIKRAFNHRVKTATRGERIIGSMFPNRGIGWPGGWTQDRGEQVQHYRNWTYVAIGAIMRQIAQLLPSMARVKHHKTPGSKVQKYGHSDFGYFGGSRTVSGLGGTYITNGAYYHKSLGDVVKPDEELEPLEHDHPCRRLLENPNPLDTSFDLLSELDLFLELCGVAYLWAIPNDFGVPSELYVIPSHWVWPRTGGDKVINPENPYADRLIQYYEVRPWLGMGSAHTIYLPPDEVLMFPWKSPINKIDGYSTLWACGMWMDMEESITKSRWSQFSNQALPSVWIELNDQFDDPNDDQIERIAAKFMAKYQGEFNQGKPLFTPAGAKVTPLSFNPQEMMYVEAEEQIRDMILSAFQVPKAVVGISNEMTFGSVLATLANFCSSCINPRLMMLGQRLTKFLAPKFHRGDEIRIWWDDCSPADPTQINADLTTDMQCHTRTPNEMRQVRGLKPYKHGGDDPLIQGPGGVIPLPINTGEDLTDLAELVPILGEGQSSPEEQQMADMGMEPGDGGGAEADGGIPGLMMPAVEEPNSEPSKEITKRLPLHKGYGPHSYSSTQIHLPPHLAARLLAFGEAIPNSELAADGREPDPHITVKYGLHTQDVKDVGAVLQGQGPVTITLGKTSMFPANESQAQRGKGQYDVLKVDVLSKELEALNKLICQMLPHTDTFPVYVPHVTVAYLKPGMGAKYVGSSFLAGESFIAESLEFCSKDGKCATINLAAKQTNKANKDQVLAGGYGDKYDLGNFDLEEVLMGMEVEREHTPNEQIRREIVADHLVEDPHYYTKLRLMEQQGKYPADTDGGVSRPNNRLGGNGNDVPKELLQLAKQFTDG